MPRVKSRRKIDPDVLYKAWQPASIGSLPGSPVVKAGQVLRGDNPIVKAAPHLFVRDGADDSEVAERWAEEFEEATAERRSAETRVEPVHFPEPVRVKDLVVAIRSLEVEVEKGRWQIIRAGTTVAKDHLAVETHPDAFAEVNPEGLAREDALVALETMSNTDESGEVTTVIRKGQWVRRDHPFIEVHPHNFALPPAEQV